MNERAGGVVLEDVVRGGAFPSQLAALVREGRRAAGLTQQQLADAAAVSVGTVRDLEQERTSRPRAESTQRLIRALGLCQGQARATAIRLRVLGPLEVWRGGVPLELGSAGQRAVLGLLALYPDMALHRETIIDALWGGDPPATAVSTIQAYFSRLRRLLDPGCPPQASDGLLVSAGTSYRLQPGDGLDLISFGRLAEQARATGAGGRPHAACALYAEALQLWRDEPLADLDMLRAHPAVIGLSQRRATVIEEYADAAAAAGLHGQALPYVRAAARREPLNERAHARLMVALAGSGQRAAALGVYAELRRRLDEQLGVQPATVMADAYRQVLSQEVGGPDSVVAGRGSSARLPVVPRQLPCSTAHFVGRAGEMQTLAGILDHTVTGSTAVASTAVASTAVASTAVASAAVASAAVVSTAVVSAAVVSTAVVSTAVVSTAAVSTAAVGAAVLAAIEGPAGIGKTALAVRWAHLAADRFPDGQLFANLRGFDAHEPPVEPAEVIRGFLDALAGPAQRIPASPEAQASLYHRLLTRRRILILLDNARDAGQVRPLLPRNPECLVVVTSRSRLTGLSGIAESGIAESGGTRPLILGPLTAADSHALLARHLGQGRIRAEPTAASELVQRCARLPLTLAVAAARAASHPALPLAALAAELRDDAGTRPTSRQ